MRDGFEDEEDGFEGEEDGFEGEEDGFEDEEEFEGEEEFDVATMSFGQERLWLVDQIQPGDTAYNVPVAYEIYGPLDPDRLLGAYQVLAERHESLRTSFDSEDNEPLQLISPEADVELGVIDLRHLPERDARWSEGRRVLAAEARRPFALVGRPPWRLTLIRIGAGEELLLVNMHHIITDAWSLEILGREFLELYRASIEGREARLPALDVQYADFAVWQREWLREEVLEERLGFWRERLTGLLEGMRLPADRPRKGERWRLGGLYTFTLGEIEPFRRLALCADATLYMTLLAGFKVFLCRTIGETDIAVGSPIAHRGRAETKNVVGFFVNTLVMRSDLTGDPTFLELLSRVREVTLDAFAHDELPFEKLVAELRPERQLDANPLLEVVFTFHQAPLATEEVAGLRLHPIEVHMAAPKVELSLSFAESPESLAGFFEYDAILFDKTTVKRWRHQLERVLSTVASAPETRVSEFDLLSPAERQQLVAEWTRGADGSPGDGNLAELFAARTARTGDRVALVSGTDALSYAELLRRADALAARLAELGVAPETRVALGLQRAPSLVVALLGVLRAGGVYVPLDTSYPQERLDFLLEDSASAFLITERDDTPAVDGLSLSIQSTEGSGIGIPSGPDRQGPRTERNPTRRARQRLSTARRPLSVRPGRNSNPGSPDQLAYVMYTSGSTGIPKGVAVTHRAVLARVIDTDFIELDENRTFLQYAAASFDVSTFEIWAPLLNGGRLVMAPPGRRALDELARLIESEKINTLWLIAPLFHHMADGHFESFAGVTQLLAGGDVVSPERAARVAARFPHCRMQNGYGPTEATVFACRYQARASDAEATSLPLGRALAETSAHVLDERLRPAATGVPGELLLGGRGLARGYLDRPAITAERFVPHPTPPSDEAGGERLYRTGDRVRFLQDGRLEFLGRLDHQVKVRGFRIEPGEVETLLERHPGVRQAVVVARVHGHAPPAAKAAVATSSATHLDRRLIAYVVPESPGVESDALREHLRERLPEYLVPSTILQLDAWPQTPSGKIDRAALPDPEAKRTTGYAAPSTPTEEVLAGVWADVLDRESPGAHDHFFDSGGDSLKATVLVSQLSALFKVPLSIRGIFEFPTLAEQATYLDDLRRAEEGWKLEPLRPRTPEEVAAGLPLGFTQERLWFLEQLYPEGTPFFNMPAQLELNGALRIPVLERTLHTIRARHEVLRTSIVTTSEGRAVQQIARVSPLTLPVVDLTLGDEASRRREARRVFRHEGRRPFVLHRGPLVRFLLLRLRPQTHILLWLSHHMISDGWTMSVLVREMWSLYEALAAGRPSPLPSLPIQYADFALWQRRLLGGSAFPALASWWRSSLADLPPSLDLPLDRPRPPLPTYDARHVRVALSPTLSQELAQVGQRVNATPFMTHLAVFELLLHRWSGRTSLAVGSPIANRHHKELEGLAGYFANLLTLRADFPAGLDALGLIAQVRETALGAYAHQDMPYVRLVEEMRPERDPSKNPLFQVSFALMKPFIGKHRFADMVSHPLPGNRKEVVLFDVTLELIENPDGVRGLFIANSGLFDPTTVERAAAALLALAEEVARHPDEPLEHLGSQTAAEREQLLGDGARLPARDRAGLPSIPPSSRPGEAPETRLEKLVADIWRAELGLETLAVDDDFFELGGHSLILPRIRICLEERSGIEVALVDLFYHRTVESLARSLEPPAPTGGP